MRALCLLLLVPACSLRVVDHLPDGRVLNADFDAPTDPCAACTSDEICVQEFANCYDTGIVCKPRIEGCEPEAHSCAPACNEAYCPQPTVCSQEDWCGGRLPHAFVCYGG
ncbi:MAG: hypothetical protein ABI678_19985 [Kofleriaceae bacterium]